MEMLLNYLICVVFSVGANAIALPFEGLYKVDIIHYNDFHARFQETTVGVPTCHFNNNSCLGGFPRLYNEINMLLREKPHAIVLNAGDSFQGTYWYTLLRWNVTQEFMNLIPHDAHTLGNHEFDDGPEGLAPYLKALNAPVVAANMNTTDVPMMQGLYVPHIIIEREGRKIGIIGLITTDTQQLSSPGGVKFTDPGEATKREAEALRDQGVDIIILLSHCGLAVDKQLAKDYGEYIDLIIGGHSHSLLWNDRTSPTKEKIEGPYPIIVEADANLKHKVLIVQASAFTKYMGNLTVYFNYKGEYVKYEGNPIFLNRSIPEDEEIKKKLVPYAKLVDEASNKRIGVTLTNLDMDDCVYGECALGDLLCDSMLEHAKMVLKTKTPIIALNQRGNIKSSIEKGNITEGDIFNVLMFNDRVLAYELQGKHLREALERSVKDAWALHPFKGPWVLQVSGLRVTYNISLPEDHRITSLKIIVDGHLEEMEDEKFYWIVAPDFLSNGGDGYVMLKNKRNARTIGRDQTVLRDFIRSRDALNIKPDGRIVVYS